MKKFETFSFSPNQARKEIDLFRQLLSSKTDLSERTDLLPLFKKNKHKYYQPKVYKPKADDMPVAKSVFTDPDSCTHVMMPLEFCAGKVTWKGERNITDWYSTIINSHKIKVTKYWCYKCGQIFETPDYTKD